MIRHEIPTHLEVEDKLLGPLTSRDALYVLVGLSAAYGIWTSAILPTEPRLALAFATVGAALLFALVKLQGRALESWLFATLVYVACPKWTAWRPRQAGSDSEQGNADSPRHPYHLRVRWRTSSIDGSSTVNCRQRSSGG